MPRGRPCHRSRIPSAFVKRVTPLIELGVGVRPEDRAGQHGLDHDYDELGAFELYLGLKLLDHGVPRAEAADFVLVYRDKITPVVNRIFEHSQDHRVFMVLRPNLLTEARISSFSNVRWSRTTWEEPQFYYSYGDLTKVLESLWARDTDRWIIENSRRGADDYEASR